MTFHFSLRRAAVLPWCAICATALNPQATTLNHPQDAKEPPNGASIQTSTQARKLLVKDGTPIKLKLKRGVYSQYAKIGDEVEYLVDEEVVVNGKIVVPEGAIVKGKVVSAEHKRRMGRGGKIDISADSIKLFNSQNIPLRAFQQARGGGQSLDMSGEMLAAASLTLGVGAPFVLFKHGKDIEIRQGSAFTAFVNGDTWLEDIAFQTKNSLGVPVPSAPVSPGPKTIELSLVSVSISSTPAGAEIELDGNFVGNTPETVKAPPGDHLLVLHKHGYARWDRKLRIAGEIVNVAADLEPE